MKKNILYLIAGLIMASSLMLVSCNKNNDNVSPPPPMAMFGATFINVALSPTVPYYTIPLQLTQPASKNVTLSFSISSPTGAKNGVQYTLDSTSEFISAGTSVPENPLNINFDLSEYINKRVDTLVLTISQDGGVPVLAQSKQLTLVISYDPVPGTYTATGSEHILSEDGSQDYGTYPYSLNKTITKVGDSTYEINIVTDNGSAAFGLSSWGTTTFTAVVNSDNTVILSGSTGYGPISSGSTPSTYDPVKGTFYLNYNLDVGYLIKATETLVKQQ